MQHVILEKLGRPGFLGLGMLLLCVFFYFGAFAAALGELRAAERERAWLDAAAARGGEAAGKAWQARNRLRPSSEAPEMLKQLNALAQAHGLLITRTTYQMNDGDGARRLEVSMPLKGGYPALRAYLREALALSPTAALEQLNLQRATATDPSVDAQIRLSYVFASPP